MLTYKTIPGEETLKSDMEKSEKILEAAHLYISSFRNQSLDAMQTNKSKSKNMSGLH